MSEWETDPTGEDDIDFNEVDAWDDEPVDDWDGVDPEVRSLLEELGIDSIGEVIVNFEDIDPSSLRGDRFATLGEAIHYLNNIGILEFSDIVYLDEDDLYGVVVPDNSGGGSGE